MKNTPSISIVFALIGTSIVKSQLSQSGSQGKSAFKKFLKAIKKSKKAQEAEMTLASEEGKHYKFKCRSLIDGEMKTWISSKTASDIRAAQNRRSSLRKVCGIDDIEVRFFRY